MFLPNLFSSFNPSSSYLNFNWSSILWLLFIIPFSFYLKDSRASMFFVNNFNLLNKEMKPFMNKSTPLNFMLALFILISMINITSLNPYTFTPTSHMTMTLNLSFPLWLMSMMYGWFNNPYNIMLSHLTPSSTPSLLIPLMVIIEMISSLIRPLTLAIRLTANMITGHLLMILLNSIFSSLPILFFPLLPLELISILLESAVAFIQAYIFFTLILLYSSEIN